MRKPSSGVRELAPGGTRGERRVAEYLRALGLCDETRVVALAQEIAGAVATADDAKDPRAPERAMVEVQQRVAAWQKAVFGEELAAIHPLWLRTFLMTHPEALLADATSARTLAQAFGDPRSGQAPVRAHFLDQSLKAARIPRWLRGLFPPMTMTAAAAGMMAIELARGGLTVAETVYTLLFAFLFALSAIGFCTALLGFLRRAPRRPPSPAEELPRSALVMPVYHEHPERVFAAIAAMRESLAATPGGEAFEIFVLSDSRDPGSAAAEERAYRRIAPPGDDRVPVYYRRRARNDRNKAGNLAEFFERWAIATRTRWCSTPTA